MTRPPAGRAVSSNVDPDTLSSGVISSLFRKLLGFEASRRVGEGALVKTPPQTHRQGKLGRERYQEISSSSVPALLNDWPH